MKKSLVALAALAATGAFAQSAVTLSGSLSFGHLVTTTRTVTSSGDSVTKAAAIGPMNTSSSNSINMTVVEDLGGGLKVTGRVDNRLTTANTARNTGDMFVQLDGGFGSLKVGQWTFASHAGYNAGGANTVAAVSTTAQAVGTSVAAYTTPSFAGLTATAGVDLDGTAGGTGEDGWGLKFNYAAGPLTAQLSYSSAVKVTTYKPVVVLGMGATYDFGVAKVFYNQTDVRSAQSTAAASANGYFSSGAAAGSTISARKGTSLSVSVPFGATSLKAGVMNFKGDSNATIIDRSMAGVDYALSKRTTVTAEFSQDKQAVTGANRTTNSFVGLTHTF